MCRQSGQTLWPAPFFERLARYSFTPCQNSASARILPQEAQETESVWRWLQRVQQDGANPINQLHVRDLRESMRNGGGPACLRLRVPLADAALAAVDPRFRIDERKLDLKGLWQYHANLE